LLTVILFPFNEIFAQIQPQTSMIQLSIPKFNFSDGEIIPINGTFLPYSAIHISLSDNYGNLENSTEVNANNTGYFQTSLGIPSHVIGSGSWHILAVSDEAYKALRIMVNNHGVVTMSPAFPSYLSPLKQYKLGVTAGMIQCHSDFQLILKKENGEFACVKKETANKLFDRGWGIFPLHGLPIPSQMPQNTTLPASFMPCNTPYSQNNTGIAVLYMHVNSTGKICVRYSNHNDTPAPIGIRIFEANNVNKDATEITTWNDSGNNTIPKGNSTIVYWIKTGNHAGFYGLTIFCVGMPFAVGYDNNSTLVYSDFPWLGGTIFCPMQSYEFHIDSLTGICVKYIPYP